MMSIFFVSCILLFKIFIFVSFQINNKFWNICLWERAECCLWNGGRQWILANSVQSNRLSYWGLPLWLKHIAFPMPPPLENQAFPANRPTVLRRNLWSLVVAKTCLNIMPSNQHLCSLTCLNITPSNQHLCSSTYTVLCLVNIQFSLLLYLDSYFSFQRFFFSMPFWFKTQSY